MDRKMLRSFALALATTLALAVVPTGSVNGLTSSASGRTVIDPNGLTNSGSGRTLIDPDGRV